MKKKTNTNGELKTWTNKHKERNENKPTQREK